MHAISKRDKYISLKKGKEMWRYQIKEEKNEQKENTTKTSFLPPSPSFLARHENQHALLNNFVPELSRTLGCRGKTICSTGENKGGKVVGRRPE